MLGGHDIGWVELFERVAALSGVRHPLLVLPREAGALARAAEARGSEPDFGGGARADGAELALLVRKARRELGYRARGLDRTLTDTIDWYRELIESGAFGGRPSALSLAAAGMRVAERTGALSPAWGRALCRPPDGRAVSVSSGLFPRDEYFMRLALREAERALEHDDVPIGAVIVHEGEVIAAARNERELRRDPTAHAEMLALREASQRLESWRLLDTVLYVTLEPCAMCAGAIVLARVPRVVYAADDPKAGAAGSVLNVLPSRGSTIAPRSQAACLLRSRRSCCAHFSRPGDRSGHFLPISRAMSVDPKAILQRIESTYGPLAEGVPSVAYVYEPGINGQCLYISPSIERVLGYSQEAWIEDGGLWDRLLHPEDAERVISNEAECASSGEALVQEYRISRADGRVVWIRDEMTVVRGEDGQDAAAVLRGLPRRERTASAWRPSWSALPCTTRSPGCPIAPSSVTG